MTQPNPQTNLLPSNPVQAAFQSIWAQFLSDRQLMEAHMIEDSREGEDEVVAVLHLILNSLPGKPDNGALEEIFWKVSPVLQAERLNCRNPHEKISSSYTVATPND